MYLLVGDARRGWGGRVMRWLCWSGGGVLVVEWRVVEKVVAGKSLVFVVKVEAELVQRFSTAEVSAVIVSMDLVLLLLAVLEQVVVGKSSVLVVVVELVQRSWSAEVFLVLKSMDSVLLSLLRLGLSVGMALRAVVTVGMFSMSGSPSLDCHLHFHLHLQYQQIPYCLLPPDLDPSTSSLQPSQSVAKFLLRGSCSLDLRFLRQQAWLLLAASGRDRVRLSLRRIWFGRGPGDIPCRSGGRRCSGWRI
jgi:hypothetical protein